MLLFNLVSPTEQRDLYEEFGLDPDRVLAEVFGLNFPVGTRFPNHEWGAPPAE